MQLIKNLSPHEHLIYHSTLSKQELLIHLQSEIDIEKAFGFAAHRHTYAKPYFGKITNNSFTIKRAINYKNSLLPEIKGEVSDYISGSKINVSMELPSVIKAFMLLWFGGVIMGCIISVYFFIRDGIGTDKDFFMFTPFLMLFFGIALFVVSFKVESRKSIKDLEEILKAKQIHT